MSKKEAQAKGSEAPKEKEPEPKKRVETTAPFYRCRVSSTVRLPGEERSMSFGPRTVIPASKYVELVQDGIAREDMFEPFKEPMDNQTVKPMLSGMLELVDAEPETESDSPAKDIPATDTPAADTVGKEPSK